MSKTPFALTYILYNKEDGVIGWIMALMSLTPVYFLLLLFFHPIAFSYVYFAPLYFFIVIYILFSFWSKWFLFVHCVICSFCVRSSTKSSSMLSNNHDLWVDIVVGNKVAGGVQQSYGMPSDHCQFMSCFCVYFTLWLCRKCAYFFNLK